MTRLYRWNRPSKKKGGYHNIGQTERLKKHKKRSTTAHNYPHWAFLRHLTSLPSTETPYTGVMAGRRVVRVPRQCVHLKPGGKTEIAPRKVCSSLLASHGTVRIAKNNPRKLRMSARTI